MLKCVVVKFMGAKENVLSLCVLNYPAKNARVPCVFNLF